MIPRRLPIDEVVRSDDSLIYREERDMGESTARLNREVQGQVAKKLEAYLDGCHVDVERVRVAIVEGGILIGSSPDADGLLVVDRAGDPQGHRVGSGVYRIRRDRGGYVAALLEQDGRPEGLTVLGPTEDPVAIVTALGDWMCEKARDDPGLYDFCRTFVACAAYDVCSNFP